MHTLRHKLLAVALLLTAAPLFSAAQPKTPSSHTAAATAPLDINTATPDQLKAFKGIGDAYAKRIIDGRPYTAKNQLVTRGILPAGAWALDLAHIEVAAIPTDAVDTATVNGILKWRRRSICQSR